MFAHDYALGQHFLPSEDGSGITGPEDIEKFLKAVESGTATVRVRMFRKDAKGKWSDPMLGRTLFLCPLRFCANAM